MNFTGTELKTGLIVVGGWFCYLNLFIVWMVGKVAAVSDPVIEWARHSASEVVFSSFTFSLTMQTYYFCVNVLLSLPFAYLVLKYVNRPWILTCTAATITTLWVFRSTEIVNPVLVIMLMASLLVLPTGFGILKGLKGAYRFVST